MLFILTVIPLILGILVVTLALIRKLKPQAAVEKIDDTQRVIESRFDSVEKARREETSKVPFP